MSCRDYSPTPARASIFRPPLLPALGPQLPGAFQNPNLPEDRPTLHRRRQSKFPNPSVYGWPLRDQRRPRLVRSGVRFTKTASLFVDFSGGVNPFPVMMHYEWADGSFDDEPDFAVVSGDTSMVTIITNTNGDSMATITPVDSHRDLPRSEIWSFTTTQFRSREPRAA